MATVALSRCRGASYTGFSADARPPKAGVSGRYPVIPPVELPVIQTTVFVVCPLTSYRQRTSRTRPELVPLFTVPLGVGNQGIDEFQHIAFRLDVGHQVIVHRLGKIYAVEHLDLVALLFLQKIITLGEGAALGVYHHIGRMGLKELGREPKSRLTRAGRTDDTDV